MGDEKSFAEGGWGLRRRGNAKAGAERSSTCSIISAFAGGNYREIEVSRKEVRMRRRWGMVGFAVVGLYEANWMVVARDIPVDYK